MIKIQYLSDMHLELSENSKYFKHNYPGVTGDILVIAGDSMYLGQDIPLKKFWKHCHNNYKYTILVPGNHEYYAYYDINSLDKSWKQNICGYDNVFYAQNNVIHIEDIDIICSTLWSNIPMYAYNEAHWGLSDFHRIKYDKHMYNQDNYNEQHQYCLDFIKESVELSTADKIVVVTHHAPSYQLVQDKFKGDTLNCCFHNDLDDYIIDSRINVWIYGHNHYNKDMVIGNTFVTSNQFGYYRESHLIGYLDGKHIEI